MTPRRANSTPQDDRAAAPVTASRPGRGYGQRRASRVTVPSCAAAVHRVARLDEGVEGAGSATLETAADGRDVWGRFGVSTAGAWSLWLLLGRLAEHAGGASC
jgi:hypothetical protein